MRSADSTPLAQPVGGGVRRDARRRPRSWSRRRAGRGGPRRAAGAADVSAGGARSRTRSRPGEDERARRDAAGAGQRRARRAAVHGELRVAVRERRRGAGALGGVWRRVAELAALDPQFQPYLEARDGIKSQLEDLGAVPAPLRRRDRSVAGAAAADRRAAGAARAAETQVRADARRRHRAARRAAARAATTSSSGDERHAELERELRGRPRRAISTRRERLSTARRRVAADFARGSKRLLARAGDGADAVRGAVRRRAAAGSGVDGAAASTRPSSSSRRIRARNCGRSRESCPAANCRASCSRSRR